MTDSVIIRSFPGDSVPEAYKGALYSKWLRSLRHGNDFFKLIDSASYYEAYQKYIAILLAKPECRVRFAVLGSDVDVILGFCVTRDNILDYVYVHRFNRRLGIGDFLIPDSIDTITHLTRTGLSIWASKYKKWKFNPFA